MENKIYDTLIIGAGPAGITAAIYLARANKDVIIIDKNGYGGLIAKSPKVENIPGFESISGIDYMTTAYNQMISFSNVTHEMANAIYIDYRNRLFLTTLEDRTVVCSKTIIVATGTEPKELILDTPDIYYCVTCDGPFFKGKNVLVAGAGNTGATYALELAEYCKTVYICDVTMEPNCEQTLKDKLLNTRNIHWLPNCAIDTVKNNKENHLASITLDTYETIKVNAIFAAIGVEPKTDFMAKVAELDTKKYIVASETCENKKLPGIFIAGDCRTKQVRQVVTAEADGAVAAIGALKYLKELGQ